MKAPLRSLSRVLSFKRSVPYRTVVTIGLGITIVAAALIIDLTSDAQEMLLTTERVRSASPRSEDGKTTLSSTSDQKRSGMLGNYDIRVFGVVAAKRVIEKSSPGVRNSDIAASAVQQ